MLYTIETLMVSINEKIEHYIQTNTEKVNASQLDLNPCIGQLYCNKQVIICRKRDDPYLQYYGGFEYIDKEYRHEIGNYVIYKNDRDRVEDAIQYYIDSKKSTEQ